LANTTGLSALHGQATIMGRPACPIPRITRRRASPRRAVPFALPFFLFQAVNWWDERHNDPKTIAEQRSHVLVTADRRNAPAGARFMLGGKEDLYAC
jgi:hypothetical protein